VVVVGDGPAGSVLARACVDLGVDVVLVGELEEWSQTLCCFVDEVDAIERVTFERVDPTIAAWGHRPHLIDRAYGVVDNAETRRRMQDGVAVRRARAVTMGSIGGGPCVVRLADGDEIECLLAVDATGGAGGTPAAWQTAFGVVFADLPPAVRGPTFMDFRPPGGVDVGGGVASFCYAVPVRDGWLVEETVLAARRPVPPESLRDRLADRLAVDRASLAGAAHTERVRIPMGGPLAAPQPGVVAFGAAAGFVHPATGYSVAASLRASGRVAAAIARLVGDDADVASVREAVWPRSARRTRALHDLGLDVMLALDPDLLRTFFDVFFDLPVELWSPYLRVDAEPSAVARTMRALFRAAPAPLRRQLVTAVPAWAVARATSRR
jgi:lycopene beta-cyclase